MENTLNTILEQMQSDTTATFKPYMVLVCKKKTTTTTSSYVVVLDLGELNITYLDISTPCFKVISD